MYTIRRFSVVKTATVVAVISACGFLDQALVCERQEPPPRPDKVILRGTGAAG